jgi:hypothetical protein
MIMDVFWKNIVEYFRTLGVKAENIYNADQIHVPFGLTANSLYADCGSQTVLIKGVKTSSCCTAMLYFS